MLNKLAFKNIKRSAKDYLIYLVTVTIAFSLIFAFNLISNSKDILDLSSMMKNFQTAMYFISAIIIFVIACLIGYTTKFIFKKRSKEFGTYMLLGIPKKQVSNLFLKEIIIFGLIALMIGFILGYLLSILMSSIIMNIFGLPYEIKFTFSLNAVYLSLLYFTLIYLVVLLFMHHRFKKMKIHDLLYFENKNENKILKHKTGRNILFIISILLGIIAFYLFDNTFVKIGTEPSMSTILICIIMLIISIYGVTFSISDFILNICLKHKKIKYKKQNLFLARSFASKVRSMSFTLATLSVLITITLVSVNFSLLFNGIFESQVDMESPYDITISDDQNKINEDRKLIAENYTIEEELTYNIYKDKTSPIASLIGKTEDFRWLEYDPVMKLSDYNTLQKMRGRKETTLKEDEYLLTSELTASDYMDLKDIQGKQITLENGETLNQKTLLKNDFTYAWISGSGYLIVVPDSKINGLEVGKTNLSVNTKEETTEKFESTLTEKISTDICQTVDERTVCYDSGDVQVKGYFLAQNRSVITIMSFALFYLAFIFTAVTGTILAIQNLSDSAEYKYRYITLNKLGLSESEINKTIFKQLLIFFAFPVIYPLISNILISKSLNNVFSTFLPTDKTYIIYILISTALFMIIYIIYFLATYFGFKTNIQNTK